MAEGVSNSNENQTDLLNNDQTSNLHEFRVRKTKPHILEFLVFLQEMVDVALNLDVSSRTNNDSKSFSF
jgi:hypothetical protein